MKDWTIFRFPSDAFLFRFKKIGKLTGIPEEDVRKALYHKKACMASTWFLVMKTYQTVLVVLSRLHVSSPFWTWGLQVAKHLGFLSWTFLGQQHAIWSLWFGPHGFRSFRTTISSCWKLSWRSSPLVFQQQRKPRLICFSLVTPAAALCTCKDIMNRIE